MGLCLDQIICVFCLYSLDLRCNEQLRPDDINPVPKSVASYLHIHIESQAK